MIVKDPHKEKPPYKYIYKKKIGSGLKLLLYNEFDVTHELFWTEMH